MVLRTTSPQAPMVVRPLWQIPEITDFKFPFSTPWS